MALGLALEAVRFGIESPTEATGAFGKKFAGGPTQTRAARLRLEAAPEGMVRKKLKDAGNRSPR
jgi:hypothetical protein